MAEIVNTLVDIVIDNTVMQDGQYIVEYATARAIRPRIQSLTTSDKHSFKVLIKAEFKGQYPKVLI